ncbi:solute carrier family 22 member 22-like [Arvicanthis niloticus]|uniref:solute carrier family 22 member 22-like n=1 Tax=Arvicanthis niloticus TaxID=61156 RepID=UPI001486BB30|nr:solute carrier family 22 member 22-like [Arvicanthis niloticus]XP_034372937.1 solute carrier family 22 member 22-like [Arvicanthis niloticus]
MAFDEILHHVGDSGRFQVWMIALLNMLSMMSSPHDIMENFTAAIPAHHCSVNLDNSRSEISTAMNLTTEAMIKVSIPMGPNQKPEQCRRFRHIQWQFLDSNISTTNSTELETEPCLDGWTYDRSVFTSTIVTEWDLVCDFQSFRYYAQATSLAGHLVAGPLGGFVSDRFGRKPLLMVCSLAYGVLGTCCAFAPNFFFYCVLKFLLSASISAVLINSLILVLEEASVQWYAIVIVLNGLFASIGLAGFGVLAYVLSDWHLLQLASALPYFIFSILYCWVPESPRWLMITGKTEQAWKELQRIASINGKKEIAQNLTTEDLRSKVKEDVNSTGKHFRIKNIIINPVIRKTVLCKSSITFAVLFSIFGLLLDIQVLGKNIFLTQILLGVIDIPSKSLTYFTLKYSRRRPLITFLLIALGSCMIITMILSEEMYVMRLTIFILGKGFYAAFTCINLAYCNELIPVALRSTVNGVFMLIARLAIVLSALTLVTRKYFVHLPMILCGVLPIVATINIYFLPETFNLPLVDSIKDMEKRDRLMNKNINKKEGQDFLETTEC